MFTLKKANKTKPKHLLVIRLSAMGDVALMAPVLNALAQQHPQVSITLLTLEKWAPIFAHIPGLKLHFAHPKTTHRGLGGLWKLSREIAAVRPSAIADLHHVLRSKIIRFFLKPLRLQTAVIDKGRAEKKALTAFSNKNFRPLTHTTARYAAVFESLGYPLLLAKEALLPRPTKPKPTKPNPAIPQPDRKEIMTRETMQQCLEVIKTTGAHTLDLTGGAPEMNPDFRWFVEKASAAGVKDFIVRSNLTIIRANKKYHDLPEFFAKHGVHVVSSLPHYTQGKTDKQRGDGVFNSSIEALKSLNRVGYGKPGSPLKLDLVYNPSGAFLPGDQKAMEQDFKKALWEDFGIEFHALFAITNLPIARFLDYLVASGNFEDYMYALVDAYNPAAVSGVMCTNTLSVSWDGYLYDCDFNQMLGLKVASKAKHISEYQEDLLAERDIVISQHCYGCTAGAGSSCQGTVA
jgi:radical SAM/Cys-rich protein